MQEYAYSVFNERTLDDIHREIQQVYLDTKLPWVIGYSGGKDSTATLQLAWNALKKLPPQQRQWPVYVISSDTLVENPAIVNHLTSTLDAIETTAKENRMPFTTHLVSPKMGERFWVNLIGRGASAPYHNFRWCTTYMKITPANRFIKDTIGRFKKTVLALGLRKGESKNRDSALKKHRVTGELLSEHSKTEGALVYLPIVDFCTEDVWMYLLTNASPWGANNKDLVTLYRNASAQGECPLVVDNTTPSCGNSRFGCWTCTVVRKDKSMEGLIDNGEEWMIPLLEYRDMLAETQQPAARKQIRSAHRKDGKLKIGRYTLTFRKQLLERLLTLQQQIRRNSPYPDIVLISEDEVQKIRDIWEAEERTMKHFQLQLQIHP